MIPRRLLSWLAGTLGRRRLIADRIDHSTPYLSRWYLFGNPTSRWFLAIHQIHKSDADSALHNHPWPYLALQLAGMMLEWQPGGVRPSKRRPGYLRWKGRRSLHRLELPPGREVWSLFLGGPRSSSWGFMGPNRIIDHKEYLKS